jgi:hypothetical protein
LGKLLSEKYGVEESARILKEVGKFQIKQAIVRYKELFDIEKMEKRKFF